MQERIQQIRDRLEAVQERIEIAAHRSGRSREAIKLVVVTKAHPVEIVEAAIHAGAQMLGENYADQAQPKIQALMKLSKGISWHMIGHIQSRKARLVADYFDYVHSIDSLSIAEKLGRLMTERNRKMEILLECNVSGEESKYGFPAWDETQWSVIADQVDRISRITGLVIRGLMTMPPLYKDQDQTRPYFIRLRMLRDYMKSQFTAQNWDELSMGTSHDFEAAIEEGATFVRIGTAILGSRQKIA
jgi:pyridoxal phosphate enzyme (YggS family)